MTANTLPLFYQQPHAVQSGRHADKSLARQPDYRFAAQTNSVPLAITELPIASRHFPIVFTAGDVPQPVAVLGLRGQQNMFVDADGQWQAGTYIPAYIRRYPFIFLENEARTEFTLCIDEAAAALVDGRDNPLFDADGKPSQLTNHALAFCRDYQSHYKATAEFAQALAAADLLVENRADITLRDGQKLSLSGFKVIDEARFNKLPDETFLEWRAKGWLPFVYCHFLSTGTWTNLIDHLAEKPAEA